MPVVGNAPVVATIIQKILTLSNGSQTTQTIAGNMLPCLCRYETGVRVDISRPDNAVAPYSVWAGALSGDNPLQGAFLLDRSDWTSDGDMGRATISLQCGWAVMARPTGLPPLRTIRISTGRPAMDQKRAALAASKFPYAMLGAIEPGSPQGQGA